MRETKLIVISMVTDDNEPVTSVFDIYVNDKAILHPHGLQDLHQLFYLIQDSNANGYQEAMQILEDYAYYCGATQAEIYTQVLRSPDYDNLQEANRWISAAKVYPDQMKIVGAEEDGNHIEIEVLTNGEWQYQDIGISDGQSWTRMDPDNKEAWTMVEPKDLLGT